MPHRCDKTRPSVQLGLHLNRFSTSTLLYVWPLSLTPSIIPVPPGPPPPSCPRCATVPSFYLPSPCSRRPTSYYHSGRALLPPHPIGHHLARYIHTLTSTPTYRAYLPTHQTNNCLLITLLVLPCPTLTYLHPYIRSLQQHPYLPSVPTCIDPGSVGHLFSSSDLQLPSLRHPLISRLELAKSLLVHRRHWQRSPLPSSPVRPSVRSSPLSNIW